MEEDSSTSDGSIASALIPGTEVLYQSVLEKAPRPCRQYHEGFYEGQQSAEEFESSASETQFFNMESKRRKGKNPGSQPGRTVIRRILTPKKEGKLEGFWEHLTDNYDEELKEADYPN